jgi:cleavage and polyadenylation specificity factor subunit 1
MFIAFCSKSPILSSYIIDLRNFDEKIINVKDFQFLHGYYEPTIFILFEPLQTWAG